MEAKVLPLAKKSMPNAFNSFIRWLLLNYKTKLVGLEVCKCSLPVVSSFCCIHKNKDVLRLILHIVMTFLWQKWTKRLTHPLFFSLTCILWDLKIWKSKGLLLTDWSSLMGSWTLPLHWGTHGGSNIGTDGIPSTGEGRVKFILGGGIC